MDSLRGFAALSIAFFHSYAKGTTGPTHFDLGVERLAAHLGLGVSVFFAISGFVLYRPWVAARAAGRPRQTLDGYAWRRFLRIVPAFWVAMVVSATVFHQHHDLLGWRGAASFGFAQIYVPGHVGILGPAWSLDTEVSWYALLPLLAVGAAWWARRSRAGEWTPVLALLGLGVAIIVASQTLLSLPSWTGALLPFWIAHFAAGMALAVASVRDWGPARRAGRRALSCVLFAGAVYAVIAGADYIDIYHLGAPHWLVPLVDTLLGLVFAVALLLPAVFDDGRPTVVRRVLGSRPVLYLGIVSYGIFLYHGAAFELAHRLGFPVFGFQVGALAGFGLTVAFAAVSWHLIERPALSLKRVVGRRGEATEPTAAGSDRPAVAALAGS